MQFLDRFEGYTDLGLYGVRLPNFKIDDKYYHQLNVSSDIDNYQFLVELCKRGVTKKGLSKLDNYSDYKDRIKIELDLFKELGYVDYLLLVWDVINFAHDNGIATGIGRGCLNYDAKVLTDLGVKRLGEIKEGDKIINEYGSYDTVKLTQSFYYSGDLISFNTCFDLKDESAMTKDHEVLIVRNPFKFNSSRKCLNRKEGMSKLGHRQWIEAKNVQVGDYLVRFVGRQKEEDISFIDLSEFSERFDGKYVYETRSINSPSPLSVRTISSITGLSRGYLNSLKNNKNVSYRRSGPQAELNTYLSKAGFSLKDFLENDPNNNFKLLRYLPVNDEFCYVLGFFIGDGWLCHTRKNSIGFAFHSENNLKELLRVEKYFQSVGVPYSRTVAKGKKLIRLNVFSKVFFNLFAALVPNKCSGKSIPDEYMFLPDHKLKSLLSGLIDSDGHKEKVGGRINYDTISEKLAYQVAKLLEYFGEICCLITRYDKGNLKSFKVRTRGDETKFSHYGAFRHQNYILVQVKDIISNSNPSNKVYDLTIDNEPSYSTVNNVVHNSCGGSLVLYLIGVTGIDPIKYGLYFERFVSRARSKSTVIDGVTYFDGSLLPDIDTDFDYLRRPEIIEYIQNKFEGRTCKILTVGTLQGKAVIKETAKICGGYTDQEANLVSNRIDKVFGAVQHISDAINEGLKSWVQQGKREFQFMSNAEIAKIACKLEGLPKNFGVHASAMGVSYQPLNELCPVQLTKDGELVSSYTKYDIEDLCVKLDVLGLKTMTVLSNLSKRTGIDLESIDVNDPEMYRAINGWQNNMYGIFQLEGHTALKALTQVKPESIDDISAINALARPGGMAHIPAFARRKNGEEEVPELHPELDKITKDTYGFIIYQEQIMRAFHLVFGFTLEEAEIIRRCITGDTLFISKSRGYVSINTLLKDGYKDDLFLVMNELGEQCWKPIKNIWSNGIKQIRKVQASNGMEVKASRWHQFLTDNGWVARNCLEDQKDYMVVAKEVEYDGMDIISENFAIICAGLITEGYFVDGREATFTNYDLCIMNRFEKALVNEFGNDYTFNNKNVLRIRNSIKNKIRKILPQGKSRSKIIPNEMMGLTKETTRKFLSFMFACEGTVTDQELSFTSVSEKLLIQIQLLLLRYGVRSSIYKKNNSYGDFWTLDIGEHKDVCKFYEELSCELQDYKILKLQAYVDRIVAVTHTLDVIPKSLSSQFIKQHGYVLNGQSGRYYQENISREKFKELSSKSKDSKWIKLANGKQEYSLLKSTKEAIREVEVYDFTIDEETPFIIANGIVIHNCIGKKKVEEIKTWKSKIYEAGKRKGLSEEVVDKFWADVEASSNYSFNKSHSMAYSILAMQCAYFKWKYPTEFFCEYLRIAKLANNADGGPQGEISKITQELRVFGISLERPDLIKSAMDFNIEGSNSIRYGLVSIRGIADKKKEALLSFRGEYTNKFEMFQAAKNSGLDIGSLSALIQAGTMSSVQEKRCWNVLEAQVWNLLTDKEKKYFLHYGSEHNYDLFKMLKWFVNTEKKDEKGKRLIISQKRYETIKNNSQKYVEIWSNNKTQEELANWFFERKLLGFSYSGKLNEILSGRISNLMDMSDFSNELDGQQCNYVGIVTDVLNRKSKAGKNMLRLTIEDTDSVVTAIFYDKAYDNWSNKNKDEKGKTKLPKVDNIVLITGQKSGGDAIFINSLRILDEKIYLKLSDIK